jgi:hypothetical protein
LGHHLDDLLVVQAAQLAVGLDEPVGGDDDPKAERDLHRPLPDPIISGQPEPRAGRWQRLVVATVEQLPGSTRSSLGWLPAT